ncbi:MAG TPA: TetR/AcrR family transcriptional regulator [Solirubrobacterales bacterium]|nr:TetR/AcrR family transcriptional regulator [Solirubrobacterales bacterium]
MTADAPEPPDTAKEAPEMIWLRDEPSASRSAHTRAEIAAAAMQIADAEGFDAVSMRRVAQELGAGTMTLYNYVRNKDELVTLMANAVVGELLVATEDLTAAGWRENLRRLAVRTRETFRRHRWALDRLDPGHPVPNGLLVFEQRLRACASLEISADDKFELIALLEDYVFGFSVREAREIAEQERGWTPEVLKFLKIQLENEELVEFRNLLGEDVEAGFDYAGRLFLDDRRFERGLDRLLDGIEVDLGR